MKALRTFPLIILTFAVGCSFTQRTHVARLDIVSRTPASSVEIFRGGERPIREYKEIAMLTIDGNWAEEPDAIQAFLNWDQRLGADAVLVEPPINDKGVQYGRQVDVQRMDINKGIEAQDKAVVLRPGGR